MPGMDSSCASLVTPLFCRAEAPRTAAVTFDSAVLRYPSRGSTCSIRYIDMDVVDKALSRWYGFGGFLYEIIRGGYSDWLEFLC